MDSGCEGNCIRADECQRLNIPVLPLDNTDSQLPTQADGVSPLEILGKAKFQARRGKILLYFEGYVTRNLQSPILCGAPFLQTNRIVQELHNKRIVIDNKFYIEETPYFCPNPMPTVNVSCLSHQTKNHNNLSGSISVVRFNRIHFTEPGDILQIQLNKSASQDQTFVVSPLYDEKLSTWPPKSSKPVDDSLTISNTSHEFGILDKEEPLFKVEQRSRVNCFLPNPPEESSNDKLVPQKDTNLDEIIVGSNVPTKIKELLKSIHSKHILVFDGDLRKGYNGYSGDFNVKFNFLNDVPPPIHYGCVPSYNKPEDDVLLQTMIDRLEQQNIVAKANTLNIVPKFASPCMLVKKSTYKFLKPGEYDALSIHEKIKYNRFVLCQNKLNDYVQKIPAKYNKLDDTIRIVGSFEYVITSDLTDSFWQRHICQEKLPYFAFHSPFKGTYIFLRSTQGFLNQSEGLEEMLTCVLQDCVQAGWCRIHADNLYVMGHSMEQTVKNWIQVLDTLQMNNLKLSPRKTSCFPDKLDLLGWSKEGKYLVPDEHRQNCLEKASKPSTVKELRSFLGSYRTFYRCKKEISFLLGKLESMVADKPSSQKLVWTPDLDQEFARAQKEIKTLDSIYLPKPNDQLVLTSDYCKTGICATLWAFVDNNFLVVARMSCKLEKTQEKLLPCDGEATAIYVAAKCPYFKSCILSSNLRTIALTDNKPVVQAANLLSQGKFSSSKLINFILTGISELNLTFQHMSGKMGQNFADDHGSRNPIECSDRDNCKICTFVSDCANLVASHISLCVGKNATLIGQITAEENKNNLPQDIITGRKNIPFTNRKAMMFLQNQDPTLIRVRELLVAGEGPHPSENTQVRRYLQKNINTTVDADGCLVVKKHSIGKQLIKRSLIIIPEDVSLGLIQGLHINLNHPSPYQLKMVIDSKFFILDRDKKIKEISDNCTLCRSVAHIPTEVFSFSANKMPTHPGIAFTVDVLRAQKKCILVAVENFSGFLSTTFINSEKAQDLKNGIIQTIFPFKASKSSKAAISIRSDRAAGFKSLAASQDMKNLGILFELGDAKNNNSVSLVDRKMQELENELKKISPLEISLCAESLAEATATVNEKIRSQGLSSKEIIFSRDQYSLDNLKLIDEQISDVVMKEREKNNPISARSKAKIPKPAISPNVSKGNLVFLKKEGSKFKGRDIYLVTAISDNDHVLITKLINTMSDKSANVSSQHHRVKKTEIFLAPNQPIEIFPEAAPTMDQMKSSVPAPLITCDYQVERKSFFIPDSPLDDPAEDYQWLWEDIDDQNTIENEPLDHLSEPHISEVLHDEEIHPIIENEVLTVQEAENSNGNNVNLNPTQLPVQGDRIAYWDPVLNRELSGTILHTHKSILKKLPAWRNIKLDCSGKDAGVNLDLISPNCVSWRYLQNSQPSDEQAPSNSSSNSSASFPYENLRITFSTNSRNPTPSSTPLNLSVPPSGDIEPSKVYKLPQETSENNSRSHPQVQSRIRKK